MDKYYTVYSLVIFLSAVQMDLICGFTLNRINDTAQNNDGNVTCVKKLLVINGSISGAESGMRNGNISEFFSDDLYEREKSNNGANRTMKDTDKNSNFHNQRERELPMAMIIAGPAAAVGIALFLCILYYWHTRQLDSKARQLSISLYISPDESSDSNDSIKQPMNAHVSRSPRSTLPPPLSAPAPSIPPLAQRRKSTLSVPSLGIPGNLHHKRGSSWSAIADQEIINISAPRRHSTFIL